MSTLGYCDHCGKELGDVRNIIDGETLCPRCGDTRMKEKSVAGSSGFFLHGWVCPKCGSVYGPSVQECSRCNASNVKEYSFTSCC